MVFAIVKSCLEPKIGLHQRVKPSRALSNDRTVQFDGVDITRGNAYFKIELNGSVIHFVDDWQWPP
jgi:hypothetical protein